MYVLKNWMELWFEMRGVVVNLRVSYLACRNFLLGSELRQIEAACVEVVEMPGTQFLEEAQRYHAGYQMSC